MRIKSRMLFTVSLALLGSHPASAQEMIGGAISGTQISNVPGSGDASAGQAATTDAADIIVTAQKRAERLQDVPKTVDVIQGDTIQKLNLRQFSDIAQLTPGLSLTPKDAVTNAITLRGIGFDPLSGSASTVDVYFNEVPISVFSAFRALYDVGQIEVLRGPQGTLRGRTSPAGAITIASRRPDLHEVDGYVQQTLTTRSGINTQGAVSVPLIDGVLGIRVAGLFDRGIGTGVRNITNGAQNSEKTESGRASIAFRPTSNLNFLLTYQHLNNRVVNYNALVSQPGATTTPILTADDRTAKAVGAGYTRFLIDQVTLGAEWDLGGVSLNYVGGYQKTQIFGERDLALGGSIPNFTQTQVSRSGGGGNWTHEARLASQGAHFWNWLIGGFYSDSDGTNFIDQPQFLAFGFTRPGQPPAAIARLNVNVDIPTHIKEYAAFTDHRFQLTSKDLLEVGLRYQWQDYDRRFTLTLNGPVLGPNPVIQQGISPDNQTGIYKQLTGSASFKHDFSRDMTGYFSYGRSYRPGGINSTPVQLDESLLVFRPEKSDSYEIGLKGAFNDRRTTYNLSVFQQDFNGYQAYTGVYLATSSNRNGVVNNNVAFTFNADARVRGVEASIATRLGKALQLGVSANYADGKFRNANAPCNDFNGDGKPDSVGKPNVPIGRQVATCRLNGRLSDQAPWNVSVNAEYGTPVGGNREFFIRGLASYSPRRRDPFQDFRYADYINNSVFVGFRGDKGEYEFSVYGKNLGNDATVISSSAQTLDYSLIPTGYGAATTVRPREFGLIGRIAF